jgi:hypothetical protein
MNNFFSLFIISNKNNFCKTKNINEKNIYWRFFNYQNKRKMNNNSSKLFEPLKSIGSITDDIPILLDFDNNLIYSSTGNSFTCFDVFIYITKKI